MSKFADFLARPLVGIAFAIALAAGAKAMSASASITNGALIIAAAIFAWEVYRAVPSGELRQISVRKVVSTGGVAIAALLAISLLWVREPRFVIAYDGKTLNGKHIVLTKVADRTRRQVLMYVDPNFPNLFTTTGMYIFNGGTEALEPDAAYLSFAGKVNKWQPNAGCWALSPYYNQEGWSTYECPFGRVSVNPQHPWTIDDFLGTPIPTAPIKAKVIVVYGAQRAEADFTIEPPQ
jgi:hypothetical protein